MLRKYAVAGMLLSTLLAASGPLRAGQDFADVFASGELPAAARDRVFETRLYLLLEQQVGPVAEYVQLTRFKNIIVITGVVKNAAHAQVIDELVLGAAGVKGELPDGSAAVPDVDGECSGKPLIANAKRRQIVKADDDCARPGGAPRRERASVYNHLVVAGPDAPLKVVETNLLLAEALVELVDAGYAQVLDRAQMRIALQDGVFYILGSGGDDERARIKAVLMALPGVRDVRFYAG